MSRFLAVLVGCLAISGPLATPARVPETGRIALVIGNSNYIANPLRNGAADAKAAAALFEQLGFKVRLTVDADRAAMASELKQFRTMLGDARVALFYYAGHAVQIRGKNYLVPTDAKPDREVDVPAQTVALDDVLGTMSNASVKVHIVLIDGCRSNPFAKAFASGIPAAADWSPGLAVPNSAPPSTFVSFAAEPGRVADDGGGSHSPYTRAVLRHMLEPGLSIEDIFKKIRQDVIDNTDGDQVPWDSSSLQSPFRFREPVTMSVQILDCDDDVFVLLNGRDVMSCGTSGRAQVSVPLQSGSNTVTIKIYNQHTFTGGIEGLGGHLPEGWRYALKLTLPSGDTLFSAREDVPAKDGPHHGKLFTVATAEIALDPASGTAMLRATDPDAWRR